MSLDEFHDKEGQRYDHAKQRLAAMDHSRAWMDLTWFIKFVAMPPVESIRKHFNLDDMPKAIKNHMAQEKGLDWFHYIILDFYRYILRNEDEDENINRIPFHTSLGNILKEYHRKPVMVKIYYRSRESMNFPVVEVGQVDERGRVTWPPQSEIPDVAGSVDLYGLYFLFNPQTRNNFLGLPRGMLKSTILNGIQCWLAVRNPRMTQYLTSMNDDMAQEHTANIRNIFESDRFKKVFPEFYTPSKGGGDGKWSGWELTLLGDFDRSGVDQPTISAFGMKTDTTGSHFDFGRLDDAETDKVQQANGLEALLSKFREHKNQILNPGAIMVVMGTIWYDFGLHMRLIRGADFEQFNLAIADCYDADKNSLYAKYTKKYIKGKEKELPPQEFYRQWRLKSISVMSRDFDPTIFQWHERDEFKRLAGNIFFDEIMITCDPTRTAGLKSDFMGLAAVGKIRREGVDELWLLGATRNRYGDKKRVDQYCEFVAYIYKWYGIKTPAGRIHDYIETRGMEDTMIELYKRKARDYKNIKIELNSFDSALRSKSDRIYNMRDIIHALAGHGKFHCSRMFNWWTCWADGEEPREVNMMDVLTQEMITFRGHNKNKHDDMLDSLAAAIELLKPSVDFTKMPSPNKPREGTVETTRREYKRRRMNNNNFRQPEITIRKSIFANLPERSMGRRTLQKSLQSGYFLNDGDSRPTGVPTGNGNSN